MGRPLTGRAAYRRGRWVARVVLHREPRTPGGDYRVAQVDVIGRDGKVLAAMSAGEKAYARRFAERLQGRYDDGTWEPAQAPSAPEEAPSPTAPAAGTVAAWVDGWCERQSYSEASRDRARIAVYLPRTGLAALPLTSDAITPVVIAAWVRELSALTSPKTRKTAAPRTVRNVYDVVRRALKSAVFEGRLVADPFAPLPSSARPKAEDADPTVRDGYRLSREEVETAVSRAVGRWRALWAVLALTGARLGEACALRWCDIREDAPLARVVFARQVHGRTREIKPTKTRAIKVVPLHPTLRAELEVWRAAWPEEYGRPPQEEDLVIPSRAESGRPWKAATEGASGPLWGQVVDRAWKRHLTELGLPAHRTHDWRHTFASLCADAGMREAVAARWTHTPAKQNARALYAVPAWEAQCREMLLLQVTFTAAPGVSVPGFCTTKSERP